MNCVNDKKLFVSKESIHLRDTYTKLTYFFLRNIRQNSEDATRRKRVTQTIGRLVTLLHANKGERKKRADGQLFLDPCSRVESIKKKENKEGSHSDFPAAGQCNRTAAFQIPLFLLKSSFIICTSYIFRDNKCNSQVSRKRKWSGIGESGDAERFSFTADLSFVSFLFQLQSLAKKLINPDKKLWTVYEIVAGATEGFQDVRKQKKWKVN